MGKEGVRRTSTLLDNPNPDAIYALHPYAGSVTKFRPTPPPPTSAEEDAGSTSTGRRRGGATPRTRDLSPIAMRSTVHLSMDGGSGDTTSSGESPTIAGRTGSQAADNLDDSISPSSSAWSFFSMGLAARTWLPCCVSAVTHHPPSLWFAFHRLRSFSPAGWTSPGDTLNE